MRTGSRKEKHITIACDRLVKSHGYPCLVRIAALGRWTETVIRQASPGEIDCSAGPAGVQEEADMARRKW